jgi:hypothetical protein
MEKAAVQEVEMSSVEMEVPDAARAAAEQSERDRKLRTLADVESQVCELIDLARQEMPVEDAAFLFGYVWEAGENRWRRQLIMIKGGQLGNYR